MGVLETKTLQFLSDLSHPTEIVFSRINPSHKNDYLIDPPSFLIT
jgi:hypothetical protein